MLVGAIGALRGMRLLDELGLLAAVIPELIELKGVEQSVYHHLDAYEHTLEVLERSIELSGRSRARSSATTPRGSRRSSIEPLCEELTRGQALRWAALLHDVAKGRHAGRAARRSRRLPGPRQARRRDSSARSAGD